MEMLSDVVMQKSAGADMRWNPFITSAVGVPACHVCGIPAETVSEGKEIPPSLAAHTFQLYM